MKKRILFMCLFVCILLTSSVSVFAAKKPKINKKNVTMYMEKSYKLKMQNVKGKVKWSSSNKKIATVSQKGVIKAKKMGKVYIIAKYKQRKYKCRVKVNTILRYKTIDNHIVITGLKAKINNLKIPSKINNKTVTEIDSYAFTNRTDLTNITLPNTITRIGDVAFYECNNLNSINTPTNLEFIGDYAFGFTNISSITIPKSCTYYTKCFYTDSPYTTEDVSLKDLIFADGITEITNDSFTYCVSLKNVTIPASVTTIDQNAFPSYEYLENTNREPFTIHGISGSYAEIFAKENGYFFLPIEDIL